jgi:hypothetical protein
MGDRDLIPGRDNEATQWVLGVKRTGRETDHPHPFSAEFKKTWSYNPTPPPQEANLLLQETQHFGSMFSNKQLVWLYNYTFKSERLYKYKAATNLGSARTGNSSFPFRSWHRHLPGSIIPDDPVYCANRHSHIGSGEMMVTLNKTISHRTALPQVPTLSQFSSRRALMTSAGETNG